MKSISSVLGDIESCSALVTSSSTTRMLFSSEGTLNIDVYHNDTFVPKSLIYFSPQKTYVMGVDLRNMEFKDFIIYLQNFIKDKCRDMYYCLLNRAIIDGLRELRDENDYVRFLDIGYSNDCKISIYINKYHKTIMEWIEEEKVEEGNSASDTCEDDVDSVMSDDVSVDHEVDDEIIEIPKYVDPFLSHKNLIPEGGVEDEADDEVVQYPIHDPNQKWDTMVPILAIVMENGISKSFNAAIVEARKKPIITMLEDIRVYVMERIYKQKQKGQKWNLDIYPSIRRRIEKMKEQQRY